MAYYFISDLHLQADRPAMAEGFFSLLGRLNDAEKLFILGDFFEVWVGDDYQDALTERIKSALSQLSNNGTEVIFMHGNRDFLMGQEFADACGAHLLDEGTVIVNSGTEALLMHGDSLCTQDVAYMNMRQLFRSPEWQAQILEKPLEERLALGRQIRSESKTGQQMKADDIMDVTQAEVDRVMSEAGVDRLIHGHTHRPDTHHWDFDGEARERIMLGDWGDDQGWLIRWPADGEPVLERFSF